MKIEIAISPNTYITEAEVIFLFLDKTIFYRKSQIKKNQKPFPHECNFLNEAADTRCCLFSE